MRARLLLISTQSSWNQRLSLELDKLGWPTLTALDAEGALDAVALMEIQAVIISDDVHSLVPDLMQRLRTACAPRRLIALLIKGANAHGPDDLTFDMVFQEDAPGRQIAMRIEHLARAIMAEEEYSLRLETIGQRPSQDGEVTQEPLMRVLTVGLPDRRFLGFNHALSQAKIEVTAAFSSYSAFDYLQDSRFDTVILWGGEDPSEALAMASGLRRNSRLFHTPILLRIGAHVPVEREDVFLRGIDDLVFSDTSDDDMAHRVLVLVRAYRQQAFVRKELESWRSHPLMDTETGLFSQALFASHLTRLTHAAHNANRPLSLCVLRICQKTLKEQSCDAKTLARALPQIGSMIARLVRAEDTAARLSDGVFGLALPGTYLVDARLACERIRAVIGCTAFESSQGGAPFVVEFEMGLSELMPTEDGSQALGRAMAQLETELAL